MLCLALDSMSAAVSGLTMRAAAAVLPGSEAGGMRHDSRWRLMWLTSRRVAASRLIKAMRSSLTVPQMSGEIE